jgi:predicted nucleotidyltransferase
MNLYDEFFAIVHELDVRGISYVVVGGIALSFHAEPRYTKDIDLLLVAEEFPPLKSALRDLGFTVEAEPWTFRSTNITLHRLTKVRGDDFLTVDLLVGNDERHREIVENAVTETTEFGKVRIATREDLIWMKRLRSSQQDLADIEQLENDKDSKSG